ncbi:MULTISPECIES: GerMN domain-containing protein [Streptomyces]|uniref:GerMN domain-containing protein n=1 Tax=Streptomyces TaxID=1883 RepID=UPI0002EE397E|nr:MULTISPECIES: GerMN domain-containing protein [Streptomyces]WTD25711.1 GerMN domain-containing protein [Streptomyces anulatus]
MKRGDVTYRRGPLRRRTAASLAAVLAAAALASGCGIRTTSVPVDAGAAPSRVPCRLSSSDVATRSPDSVGVTVYLVCTSQLVTVDRPVSADATGTDPLVVARALLKEVQQAPPANERRAGFTTAIPEGLRVTRARDGDPEGTVRLSSQPEDLSAEALAQLVCTYAENETLVTDGSVVLGGPGDYPPRGYLCTSQTKSRPGDLATPDAVLLN